MELIEKLQNKSEQEMIEEFLEYLEIDDKDKYTKKMKGIYKMSRNNKLKLPKINIKENILINNKKTENSKSNSVLTYNKKEYENNIPKLKKINIGKQFLVKDMEDKEKGDTPKRERIMYDSEESEEEKEEKSEKDEKANNLPVIESAGIPLFSKKKLDNN